MSSLGRGVTDLPWSSWRHIYRHRYTYIYPYIYICFSESDRRVPVIVLVFDYSLDFFHVQIIQKGMTACTRSFLVYACMIRV